MAKEYTLNSGRPKNEQAFDEMLDSVSVPVEDPAQIEVQDKFLDSFSEPVNEEVPFVEGVGRALERGRYGFKSSMYNILGGVLRPDEGGEARNEMRPSRGNIHPDPIRTPAERQAADQLQAQKTQQWNELADAALQQGGINEAKAQAPELRKSLSAEMGSWQNPNFKWFYENGAENAYELAGQVGLGMATRGLSVPARIGMFGAVSGLPAAGATYGDAIKRKDKDGKPISHDVALAEAMFVGLGTAALDSIPASEFLLINPASRKMFSKAVQSKMGDLAVRTGAEMTTEGLTEGAQVIVGDVVRWVAENDPKAFKDWSTRYPNAAFLGAAVAGPVGVAGSAVGHVTGTEPLGQPAPAEDLIAKAPKVAEFLAERIGTAGKVSRTEWAKAAKDAKEQGVSLPYYRQSAPATEYAQGVAKALAGSAAAAGQQAAQTPAPAPQPQAATAAAPEGSKFADSTAYYNHLVDIQGLTPDAALKQIESEGFEPPVIEQAAPETSPPAEPDQAPTPPSESVPVPQSPETPAAQPEVVKRPAGMPAFKPLVTPDLPEPVGQDADGNDIRVLEGMKTTFASGLDGADGVRYELHRPAKAGADGGVMRTVDMNGGMTVAVMKYPTWNKAVEAYAKATAIANKMPTEFKPGPESMDNGNVIDIKPAPKGKMFKQPKPKTIASEPAADNTKPATPDVPASQPSVKESDRGQKESSPQVREGQADEQGQGRQEGLLKPTGEPVAGESSAPAGSIRKGKVGDMLSPGEVVTTSSGRQTSPFPKPSKMFKGKTTTSVKKIDEWLRQNAIDEAAARGDEFNARSFRNTDPNKLSQADKDGFEEYLFGEQPKVVRSPLKPMNIEAEKELLRKLKDFDDNANGRRKVKLSDEDVQGLRDKGYIDKGKNGKERLSDAGFNRMVEARNAVDAQAERELVAREKAAQSPTEPTAQQPAPQQPTAPTVQSISPTRATELRSMADPVLDLDRNETGWLGVRTDNGMALVHPTEDKAIQFEAENKSSGTQTLRARMEAQAYAIDNPITADQSPDTGKKVEQPAGELVVKPLAGAGKSSAIAVKPDVVEVRVDGTSDSVKIRSDDPVIASGKTYKVFELTMGGFAPVFESDIPEFKTELEAQQAIDDFDDQMVEKYGEDAVSGIDSIPLAANSGGFANTPYTEKQLRYSASDVSKTRGLLIARNRVVSGDFERFWNSIDIPGGPLSEQWLKDNVKKRFYEARLDDAMGRAAIKPQKFAESMVVDAIHKIGMSPWFTHQDKKFVEVINELSKSDHPEDKQEWNRIRPMLAQVAEITQQVTGEASPWAKKLTDQSPKSSPSPVEADSGDVAPDPYESAIQSQVMADTAGKQVAIPGMESVVARAEATRKIWGPVERELLNNFTPEFADLHRDVVLRQIPDRAQAEMAALRESGMTPQGIKDAIPDRAYDTYLELPEFYPESFIKDPITGKPPTSREQERINEQRIEAMQAVLIDAMNAEYKAQLPDIQKEYKQAQDAEQRQNQFDIIGDVMYDVPKDLDNPQTDAAKAKREEWFKEKAKKLGYDPDNLADAWQDWKDNNDGPVVDINRLDTAVESVEPPPANPAYRDWRWQSKTKNSGWIRPNRVGSKFDDVQIGQITTWVKAHGWTLGAHGPNGIEVLDPRGDRLDLSLRGAEGVKREAAAERQRIKEAEVDAAKAESQAKANARKSAPWINAVFGADKIAPMNREALSDFLEGKTKKFKGLVNTSWRDGLESIGALSIAGDQGVDWQQVLRSYEESKASKIPLPPTDPEAVVSKQPDEPVKFKRSTLPKDHPDSQRNQWREESANAREKQRPLEEEMAKLRREQGGLRSNAHKKRAAIQEKIDALAAKNAPLIETMRINGLKIDEAVLEDQIEETTDPVRKLSLLHDLYRTQAKLLPTDRWHNARDSSKWSELNEKADDAILKAVDVAKGMIDDPGLTDSERDWAASHAVNTMRHDPRGLAELLPVAIAQTREARLGGCRSKLAGLKELTPERLQELADEMTATAMAGKDWLDTQNAIMDKASKENSEAATANRERRIKEAEEKAKQAEIDRGVAMTERRQQAVVKHADVRFWKELRKTAGKIKTTKGEVLGWTTEYGKDGKAVKETRDTKPTKGDVIGKYIIVESKDDNGKKDGYSLLHVASGKHAASATAAVKLKQIFAAAEILGIDLQAIDDEGRFPPEISRTASKLFASVADNDFSGLTEEQVDKLLSTVRVAPHNVKADMVLSSFDMGMHNQPTGPQLNDKGALMIKGENIKDPLVRAVTESTGIAGANPAFRAHPVFTVDDNLNLTWKSGNVSYTLHPAVFNLGSNDLKPGMTIGINLADMAVKKVSPLTAAQAVALTIKPLGFTNVSVGDDSVVGYLNGQRVTMSGQNNQWSANGRSDAHTKANAALEQMGWLAGKQPEIELTTPTEIDQSALETDAQDVDTPEPKETDDTEADVSNAMVPMDYEGPDVLFAKVPQGPITPKQAKALVDDFSVDNAITTRPPETKQGRRLLDTLVKDSKSDVKKVGRRTIIETLADRLHALIIVGKSQTTRRNPAHYRRASRTSQGEWQTHLIRTRSADSQINFHELGHALSAILADRAPGWRKKHAKMLTDLTYLYSPNGGASAHSPEEGLAEFIRRSIVTPDSLPVFSRKVLNDAIDAIDPKIMANIRDSHRAYAFHRSRSLVEQTEADRNDKGVPSKFFDWLADQVARAAYAAIGPSTVTNRLNKKVHYAISLGSRGIDKLQSIDPFGIIGAVRNMTDKDYRLKRAKANRAIKRTVNTAADFEVANRTADVAFATELSQVMGGVTHGREGVRVYNDVPDDDPNAADSPVQIVNGKRVSVGDLRPSELAALASAGFAIPDAVEQGKFMYLSDESFQKIKTDVGEKNWNKFVSYGQMKTELSRWEDSRPNKQGKRLAYPGRADGKTPDAVRAEVARLEKENPTFLRDYKRVEAMYSGLLFMEVLSGERTVEQAIKMRTAYEHYWAQERQLEDRKTGIGLRGQIVPSSGVGRADGSDLQPIPLDEMMLVRSARSIRAFYDDRRRKALARYIATVTKGNSLPFKDRTDIGNLMVPLNPDLRVAATLTPQEQTTIVAEGMNREYIAANGLASQFVKDMGVSLESGKQWQLEKFLKSQNLTPVTPDLVVIASPGVKIYRNKDPNARYVIGTFNKGEVEYWQIPDMDLYDTVAGGRGMEHWNDATKHLYQVFQEAGRSFSRGITQSLPFATSNVAVRDALSAYLTGDSFIPYFYHAVGAVTIIKAVAHSAQKRIRGSAGLPAVGSGAVDPIAEIKLMIQQITNATNNSHAGHWYSSLRDMAFEGIVDSRFFHPGALNKVVYAAPLLYAVARKWGDLYNYVGGRQLSAVGEALPRLGMYVTSLKHGDTDERAAMRAGRITGEFGQRPSNSALAKIAGIATFINAGVQIMHGQAQRHFDADPMVRMKQTVKLGLLPIYGAIGASAAYLAKVAIANLLFGPGEEEEKEEFVRGNRAKATDFERTNTLDVAGVRINAGKGHGAGLFMYGWSSIEGMLLDDPVSAESMAWETLDKVFSMPELNEFIPHDAKTAIELSLDHSFYREQSIVPDRINEAFQNNPEYRAFADTPQLYKSIAESLSDMPVVGRSLASSPIKWQYYIGQGLSKQLDELITLVDRMSIGEPLERNELPFIGRLMTRESRGYNSQDVKTVGEIASEYDRLLTDIKVKLSRDRNDPMAKELGAKALSIGGAYDKMVELNEMYSDVRKLRAQKKWDEADKIERKMTTEAGEFLKNPAELKGGIPKLPEKPKIGSKNYQERMKSYWERRAVYDAIVGE